MSVPNVIHTIGSIDQSWKDLYPEYDIKEWNLSQLEKEFGKHNKECYKYCLMYKYGGIYTDPNIEVKKRLQFNGNALLDGRSSRVIVGQQGQDIWKQLMDNPNVKAVVDKFNSVIGNIKSDYFKLKDAKGFLATIKNYSGWIVLLIVVLLLILIFVAIERK